VRITAVTTGDTLDADGYEVVLDGSASLELGPDGTALFSDVAPGSRELRVRGVAPNCDLEGDTVRAVLVPPALEVTEELRVRCRPALRNRIVFANYDSGTTNTIWAAAPDGSGLTRLTPEDVFSNSPAISPDGTRIAYARAPQGGEPAEIWVVALDGSPAVRVTDHPARDLAPTWSPDGSRIAFMSDRSGTFELWSMEADGSDLRRITSGSMEESNPDWSPDGERLAFWDNRGRESGYIWLVDADGSDLTGPVGNAGESRDPYPTWSPSGDRLAFTSDRGGDRDIWTMRPDGSDPRQLTRDDASNLKPSWGPRGERLVYASFVRGISELRIVDVGSGESSTVPIPLMGEGPYYPDWSPVR
jgi:TolB protein